MMSTNTRRPALSSRCKVRESSWKERWKESYYKCLSRAGNEWRRRRSSSRKHRISVPGDSELEIHGSIYEREQLLHPSSFGFHNKYSPIKRYCYWGESITT